MAFELSQPRFLCRDWLLAMSKAHMLEHSALRWVSGAAPPMNVFRRALAFARI